MAEHNWGMIIVMVIAILLLFTSMVLSAMAASDATKGGSTCQKNCHTYAMWAAIVNGISVLLIFIAMVMYLTRRQIAYGAQRAGAAAYQYAQSGLSGAHDYYQKGLGGVSGQVPPEPLY